MHWGVTFLNRFDFKVRNAGQVTHPVSGEEFRIDLEIQAQSFRRAFGEVVQFNLSSGIIFRTRFKLAAISLPAADIQPGGDGPIPAADLLQQIAAPTGLDFADDIFYCIGIFSPSGWPEEWKAQIEIRGNALYYLVQKEASTIWTVMGTDNDFKQLFDPELPEEKSLRCINALQTYGRLILPGDQVAVDAFLEEHRLDLATILRCVKDSKGLFEIAEYKGKSYIQRCIR